MNSLTYIAVLLSFIFLPAVLFAAFWLYVLKRGWGSKWLLAFLLTFCLSLINIVIWLGVHDNLILTAGLGVTLFGGIVFYIWLKNSPISSAIITNAQQAQNNLVPLSKEESENLTRSRKLMVKDVLAKSSVQNIPIIIGVGVLFLLKDSRSSIVTSLTFFIFGFTGILRIVLPSKEVVSGLYSSKSKLISGVLITIFAWGIALYALTNK